MDRGPARYSLLFAGALLAACHGGSTVAPPADGGLQCKAHERIIDGQCTFVCERNPDCPSGEGCNVLTGKCEGLPPEPDASVSPTFCTFGATRCRADQGAIEACDDAGTWVTTRLCPAPGVCENDTCLACRPGATSCDLFDAGVVDVCKDDGSGFTQLDCQPVAPCADGECRECTPNATRCSPDGTTAQTCEGTRDPSDQWAWTNSGDAFDGTCITQQCVAATGQCVPPQCFPGTTQCKPGTPNVLEVCSSTGQWQDQTCSSAYPWAPAVCSAGACVDECGSAAAANSYYGCEYWGAVMDNGIDPAFKGGTASGQGSVDSDFTFVVSNRSAAQATVTVYRSAGGSEQTVKTVTVPPKSDPTTHGQVQIPVPWQSIGPPNPSADPNPGYTGIAPYGYRLTSTKPVTVYQFNPLDAKINATCANNNGVNENGLPSPPCYSFSQDASLLLPTHILGTGYVLLAPSILGFTDNQSQGPSIMLNNQLTLVATQDATHVTVKSSAKTLASAQGAPVSALTAGQSGTFSLNRYDVLQIATDNLGGSYLQCTTNPYYTAAVAGGCGIPFFTPPCPPQYVCRIDNDITGTVVTTDQPVAVFGGSACSLEPYDQVACDHTEEEMLPFATWGENFIAAKSHPIRYYDSTGSNPTGTFASPQDAAPDYWKIVAGCPAGQQGCPDAGTLITLNPIPGDLQEVLGPGSATRCTSGSLSGNTCRLNAGSYVELSTKQDFAIQADAPIQVAQIFAGENATTAPSGYTDGEGDPSIILLPPVEQWRPSYTVLSGPTTADNFLSLAIDASKVAAVFVDGTSVPLTSPTFNPVGTTSFRVTNYPVGPGTHTISITAQPGQKTIPGAGVTAYGFDSYESYGYTGGLDLGTLVTGVNPGG